MSLLDGHVAIVTGASKGIGQAIAITLARNGVKTVLVARSHDRLHKLATDIEQEGEEALPVVTDVTDQKQVSNMLALAIEHFGRLDILVNNAGSQVSGPLHTFDERDFDSILSTNLKGVFLCTRAVLPMMLERRRGHIVNIASVSGLRGWANDGPYTASKWGVLGLSESVDEEVRQHGIKVTCICPGSVDTDLIDEWIGPEDPRRPLLLSPEDIANAVLYVLTQPSNVSVDQLVIRPMVETLYSDYLPASALRADES